ncbi:hypothetical protein Tco_1146105 [Tanacetum coccineum]
MFEPFPLESRRIGSASTTISKRLKEKCRKKTLREIVTDAKVEERPLDTSLASACVTLNTLRSRLQNLQQKDPEIMENFLRYICVDLTKQTAPVHSSSRPNPNLLTPGPISSGLVPNSAHAIPYVPPTNKDLELLFQPMFDEYFETPTGDHQMPHVPVVPPLSNLVASELTSTIDLHQNNIMAIVNVPVEQALLLAPPHRTVEQILPRFVGLPIGKAIAIWMLGKVAKPNPIYKIVGTPTIINLCITGKTSGFERPKSSSVADSLGASFNRAHIRLCGRMGENYSNPSLLHGKTKRNLAQHTHGKEESHFIVIPSVQITTMLLYDESRQASKISGRETDTDSFNHFQRVLVGNRNGWESQQYKSPRRTRTIIAGFSGCEKAWRKDRQHGSRLYRFGRIKIFQSSEQCYGEIVTELLTGLLHANIRERFRDLPEADMKEILHNRMWESKSYQTHEDHMTLYEALEKSMARDNRDQLLSDLAEARKKKKKRQGSPKTPSGSPPPLPPPAGPFGTSGASSASGLSQSPPPPPPPSNTQGGQSTSTAAPSSSKTAASAEYTAWTMTDTRIKPSVSPIPEELHMETHSTCSDRVYGNIMDWYCKKQGISELTQKDLEGPAYEIVKVFHPTFTAENRQARLVNLKMKAAYYPDVGLEQMVPDQMWIEEECKYDVAAMYGISHWWFQRQRFYIDRHTSERDFKISYPRDLKDLVLVESSRMEDFQLGIKSYQTQLNLTKPRWDAKGFEYKHDFTIDEALDYRVKEFRVNRMNPGLDIRFWTKKDVDRSKEFMFSIQKNDYEKTLIFRNLESFVGGRIREEDSDLLKKPNEGTPICAKLFRISMHILKGSEWYSISRSRQSQRDLPRDYPLVSVDVLRVNTFYRLSHSESDDWTILKRMSSLLAPAATTKNQMPQLRTNLKSPTAFCLMILPLEHRVITKVFTVKMENPARANIKQALGNRYPTEGRNIKPKRTKPSTELKGVKKPKSKSKSKSKKSKSKSTPQSQRASPPDSELVSFKGVKDFHTEDGEIEDDILCEKLSKINLLIAKIEAINYNPPPSFDFVTKSPSIFPNSFLEETNTFDNSIPKSETFCFDLGENRVVVPNYLRRVNGAIPLLILIFLFLNMIRLSLIFRMIVPPADRSDFYHEEFADELAHIISPPEYDCFYFKSEPDTEPCGVRELVLLTAECVITRLPGFLKPLVLAVLSFDHSSFTSSASFGNPIS